MIYRVQGFYASGRFVSHLVEARDASHAQASVHAADSRIIRFTSILPTAI